MPRTWFTSDTHFGHANILRYCTRPFTTVAEMDEELIRRWNAAVQPDDTVYHLGDFALFKDMREACGVARRLAGRKHLVYGNHDAKRLHLLKGFDTVQPYLEIKLEGRRITLMHYPMKSWAGSHKGSWQLHGHCHGNMRRDPALRQWDVGVDVWAYAPVSFEELVTVMDPIKVSVVG